MSGIFQLMQQTAVWPGAVPAPMPAVKESPLPPLDVAETFAGRNILLIGTTGFVGKVALSMLLVRYPGVGKVFCLVRPGAGATADERFYRSVARSRAFDPLRAQHGEATEAFLRSKIVAIAGDIGRPLCNFTDQQFDDFAAMGGIDVILNSAGLVSFQPSLESAIRINALGAQHVVDVARRCGAKLVHVSTCYVAGCREGDVWEDEPVVGYFPRHNELLDRDFDAVAEVADCQRIIEQTRELSNDRAHVSIFREKAAASLREQRRDPDDADALKLGVAREKKIWLATELTKIGMERSLHWGWTNTYTYTKSLGEQLILRDSSVVSTIVRPAVVESSVRFPMPGWNEGFNTTAPLVYLSYKGHRNIPAGRDTAMDVIPVDFVAAGMLMATAAVLVGRHERVYQLGASDVNRVTARRLTELTGLAVRQHHRKEGKEDEHPLRSKLKMRLETQAVSIERYRLRSAPMFKKAADALLEAIDTKLPTWGAPRVDALAAEAKTELEKLSRFTGQVIELVDIFKPFNYDRDITFRCDNTRSLWAQLAPDDQERLLWAPHCVDWRHYWMNTHFEGLKTWVFSTLDEEFGQKPKTVHTYKHLVEFFETTVKLHRHHDAMRLFAKDVDQEPVRITYAQLHERAHQGAAELAAQGAGPDQRVMFMSENRPEWGMTYFATLLTGAAAVPLDAQLSAVEVKNLVRAARPTYMLLSLRHANRLAEEALGTKDASLADLAAHFDVRIGWIEEIGLSRPGTLIAPIVNLRGDMPASIIFTSGTTGTPKGVVLTHKNLTAMTSKLAALFSLFEHDRLLSVLPLHHTFEFSGGFLMPLFFGASIDYLEEIDADSLGHALEHNGITGLVGVPALWQMLERKIWKRFADQGEIAERAFDMVVDAHEQFIDKMPWKLGTGRVLFYPVHKKLGGRLRLLISGGSALSAETLRAFRGLGLNLLEGYGMTEASPVIAVTRPGDDVVPGSVGLPLPGVDVKIDDPDANGIGEIVARGPTIMAGYFENPDATAQVLRDGWLHTGDLGRLDEAGRLFIVGRKKEMILGAAGENIYPDELEEAYRDCPHIKELTVVGLPDGLGHETVASLVVPEYGIDGATREVTHEAIRAHIKSVSASMPVYKRLRVFHLWDHDLPKTSTRKVKRREVIAELERLERAGQGAVAGAGARTTEHLWVRHLVADTAQRRREDVTSQTRMSELGFDSLMYSELAVVFERAGVGLGDVNSLLALETVADVEAWAVANRKKSATPTKAVAKKSEIEIPGPVVHAGRKLLRSGMRALYERYLDSHVFGSAHVPPHGGFIVAANHASHLDTGLVKHALGPMGDALVALAAKDYFFDDPIRRIYFENFTNLVPMERHGSLRESLRVAGDVLRDGYVLLIFPEGTRSDSGVMIDFKPSLGYLAMANRCGILPMHLVGTRAAMKKGDYVPRKGKPVSARVAPFISFEEISAMAQGKTKSEAYKTISLHVERVVRGLCPPEERWMLGESGLTPDAMFRGQP